MTVYWDNAMLDAVKIRFDIYTDDGSDEHVCTTSYIPDETDVVKVQMEYKDHAFRFENRALVGIRNGTPEYIDPRQDRSLTRYADELAAAVVKACNSTESFKRGQLPEGIIEVLRQGADIEPYFSAEYKTA